MSKEKIIRNYANSLFELAQNAKSEEVIYKEFIQITDIILSSDKLYNFLCSPIILSDHKQKMMNSITQKLKCNELLLQFFYILIDNMRVNVVNQIKEHYYNLLLTSQGIKIVDIIAADKLADKQLEKIKSHLEQELNMIVKINVTIDESLISGVVIKYDSSLFDCSVVGMLQTIKKKISLKSAH